MTVHSPAPKTLAETELQRQFAALPQDAERAAAFHEFQLRGLPSRRDEAWHYTDLRAALKIAAAPAPAPDAARIEAAKALLATHARVAKVRIVLVDGRLAPALSDPLPDHVAIGADLASPPSDAHDAVIALNLAFAEQALRIDSAAEAPSDALEIVHVDGPGAVFSRVAVNLGAGAKLTVFERFLGATEETQRYVLSVAELGEGARCDWTVAIEDRGSVHLGATVARLAAKAEFCDFGLVAGGDLVRRQLDIGHSGPDVKIALSGLSLLDGRRHADTTLTVRHAAPHGESREFFRHIIADDATGVYQGKVIVAPHAQKTDGGMKSQALLLSPAAIMYNKPELEIFADDVVCGHGATVGALDPDQIFYLQARGLPKAEAEGMLLEGFGVEAISRVADEAVAEFLQTILARWLKERAA